MHQIIHPIGDLMLTSSPTGSCFTSCCVAPQLSETWSSEKCRSSKYNGGSSFVPLRYHIYIIYTWLYKWNCLHPPIVSNCETGPGKFRFLLQVMVAAMKTKQSSEIGPVVAPAGLVKPWHLDSTPKYLDLWMWTNPHSYGNYRFWTHPHLTSHFPEIRESRGI